MVPDSKNPENYNVFQNLWNNPIKFGIPIDSVTVLFIEQKILKNPMNKKLKSKHIAVYIFSFVVSHIHQISCGTGMIMACIVQDSKSSPYIE